MTGTPVDQLSLGESRVVNRTTGEEVSFSQIACHSLYSKDQFQIQASASFTGTESPPPFAAQFAEVDVDTETGRVRVVKFVSVVDCGQAINPKLAEGQVDGAVLNGISFALSEQYLYNQKGAMTNSSFWDYKIYGTLDMPEMVTVVLDSNEPSGPYGAKSVSEIGINCPAPAIANAVYDAIGVRIYDLPLTPEKVLKAIRSRA